MQARTFFPASIPFAILLAGCIAAIPSVSSDNRAAGAKAIRDMEDGRWPTVVAKYADKPTAVYADDATLFPGDMPAVTEQGEHRYRGKLDRRQDLAGGSAVPVKKQ